MRETPPMPISTLRATRRSEPGEALACQAVPAEPRLRGRFARGSTQEEKGWEPRECGDWGRSPEVAPPRATCGRQGSVPTGSVSRPGGRAQYLHCATPRNAQPIGHLWGSRGDLVHFRLSFVFQRSRGGM